MMRKKQKLDLGTVQVYLASLERGIGKETVKHWRLEVVGECMGELGVRSYVLDTVTRALRAEGRLLVK